MADLFWLSDAQWAVIEPFMPKNQPGARRVDDRQTISGIVGLAAPRDADGLRLRPPLPPWAERCQRQPLLMTCTMPEIVCRSSTRRAPGRFLGMNGSITAHCASDNQNRSAIAPSSFTAEAGGI